MQKENKKETKVKKQIQLDIKIITLGSIAFFLIVGLLVYLFTKNIINSFAAFIVPTTLLVFYLAVRKRLKRYNEVKKMENVFPDFISLMASNLRASMTIDRALLLSSRKEFAPLDKEIVQVGKDILTAREITTALQNMAERIGSDEIKKTVQLIISGLRSGGNLSIILEQTANNMRERMFIQKRAASNVLMYIIFIIFAVSIGAPLLFGLSSVLVGVLTGIFKSLPETGTGANLPFSFSEINISMTFIFYFSMTFILAMNIMAALMIGLVSKGQEKEGLKYIIPLTITGVIVYLISRKFLLGTFSSFFS